MKLLLTSGGLRNTAIVDALASLVGRPFANTKIAFVPTAANAEPGDKRWFVNQLSELLALKPQELDIIDFSALPKAAWLPRISAADVIYIGGGNTYYLLDRARATGFDGELGRLLQSRVYVGVSAGSILLTPNIDVAHIDNGDTNDVGMTDMTGLKLVNFEVSPHTPESVSHEANSAYAKTITNKLYSYDDQTAIMISGKTMEFVGTGQHWEYN